MIPAPTSTNEDFAKTRASSRLFSELRFAIKRETPNGIPIVATVAKILAIEITVEDVPMMSGVAILVNPNHKR
jgi:hypothetical protein